MHDARYEGRMLPEDHVPLPTAEDRLKAARLLSANLESPN